jgi:hypothetical protein
MKLPSQQFIVGCCLGRNKANTSQRLRQPTCNQSRHPLLHHPLLYHPLLHHPLLHHPLPHHPLPHHPLPHPPQSISH